MVANLRINLAAVVSKLQEICGFEIPVSHDPMLTNISHKSFNLKQTAKEVIAYIPHG